MEWFLFTILTTERIGKQECSLIKKHQRIILFAITKPHAIVLNSLLTAIDIKSNVLTSDTSPIERNRIINNFKI